MSEVDPNRQRYEILIQQAVDGRLNPLIQDARQLVDDFLASIGNRESIGPTQMNNLLGVCGETDSVEAVVGYVQYQIGRDSRRNTWAMQDFGEKLIHKLNGRRPEAEALVNDATRRSQHSIDRAHLQAEVDRVWMLLVRQYVGHLRRYLTYKRPKEVQK